MPTDKINNAIRECLDHCHEVPHPHLIAASFLAGLRRRPDWTQDEVDQVSAAVAMLLPKQVDGP